MQIVKHGMRISQIHRILDEHTATGSVPVPKDLVLSAPDDLTRGQIARILCNYPPNITKAKRKIAQLPEGDPEILTLLQNIETWEADLNRARSYKNQE
jgi:hypothetical protein